MGAGKVTEHLSVVTRHWDCNANVKRLVTPKRGINKSGLNLDSKHKIGGWDKKISYQGVNEYGTSQGQTCLERLNIIGFGYSCKKTD